MVFMIFLFFICVFLIKEKSKIDLRFSTVIVADICEKIVRNYENIDCENFNAQSSKEGYLDGWGNNLLCEKSEEKFSQIISLGEDGAKFGFDGDADVLCYKNTSIDTQGTLFPCSCRIRSGASPITGLNESQQERR
ncbi:MAG: hypothetical protein ACK5ME_02100 [Parahaliea sp.]